MPGSKPEVSINRGFTGGSRSDLADWKERLQIRSFLHTTILAEAGAGSGKTRSLVDRMIALLKYGVCRVENLAAVTFTRKAAAELQERFQTALEQAYAEVKAQKESGPKNSKVLQKWNNLGHSLRNLEQCFVGTIHSFCGRILRERPVEAELMPDFREMDDVEDIVYQDACWQDFINRVRGERPPELTALEEVGIEPEDLKEAFGAACQFPEVDLAGGREDPPEYGRLRRELETLLTRLQGRVPVRDQSEDRDGIMTLTAVLSVRRRIRGFDDPLVLMETLEGLDRAAFTPTLKHWPDPDAAKAVAADLEVFRDDVVRPALIHWREYRHNRVIPLLKKAVAFYEQKRRDRSLVNFTDLLLSVAGLLRDNPEVRAYFQKKFTHILVDEFQDTDPIQAEILFYLTGEVRKERDWQKIIPKPGSLFLVGDPKQSIYRFRRADLDTYKLVRGLLTKKAGGKGRSGRLLRLTTNFRSLHSLADFNNALFRPVFPDPKNGNRDGDMWRYQADFAELKTVRPDVEGAWSGVFTVTVDRVFRNNQEKIAAEDAGRIARWIKWALDGNVRLARTLEEIIPEKGVVNESGGEDGGQSGRQKDGSSMKACPATPARPEDFLILFRYKKLMNIYARSLEARGIPYEITGSKAFAEDEDVAEIFNLVRALRDPGNPVDTLAVLRGIFFGLADDRLYLWKKHHSGPHPFSFLTRTVREENGGDGEGENPPLEGHHKEDPSSSRGAGGADSDLSGVPDEARPVAQSLARMNVWWRWTKKYPPTVALKMILEDAGLIPYLAGGELGSSRAGNVFKLLAYLEAKERDGETDFAALADFMDELMKVREVEEMGLLPGRRNAVRLMNLHKAKGLEAPVVFLANPKGTKEYPPDKHVERRRNGGEEVRVSADKQEKDAAEARPAGPDNEGKGPQGYFVFSRKKGEFQTEVISQPVDWAVKESEERLYDDAEEDRLMYVAATRARNMLVISTYDGKLTRWSWSRINDYLKRADVCELEGPPSYWSGIDPKDRLTVSAGEVEKAREGLRRRFKTAGRESYGVESVTALSKEEGEAPFRGETGRGMSWGRMIHGILEAAGRDGEADLELLAENALLSEDWDLSEKRALAEHVKGIITSEFWGRMKDAEEKYFEVPFALQLTAAELDLERENRSGEDGSGKRKRTAKGKTGADKEDDPDLPIIVHGVIDLVFKENGEWVIVDYKTDEVGRTTVSLRSLVDYYTPQVRMYTRFWEEITGEPVRETALYFTSVGKFVNIEKAE